MKKVTRGQSDQIHTASAELLREIEIVKLEMKARYPTMNLERPNRFVQATIEALAQVRIETRGGNVNGRPSPIGPSPSPAGHSVRKVLEDA